mmetsp:Transcript_9834/g.24784  ORF Transcript_9834/g.24784 Transcript_9834/m.24784 type:complete len:155 (+) Transcript_9834:113-577(+)
MAARSDHQHDPEHFRMLRNGSETFMDSTASSANLSPSREDRFYRLRSRTADYVCHEVVAVENSIVKRLGPKTSSKVMKLRAISERMHREVAASMHNHWILSSQADMFFTIAVVLNSALMGCELELRRRFPDLQSRQSPEFQHLKWFFFFLRKAC